MMGMRDEGQRGSPRRACRPLASPGFPQPVPASGGPACRALFQAKKPVGRPQSGDRAARPAGEASLDRLIGRHPVRPNLGPVLIEADLRHRLTSDIRRDWPAGGLRCWLSPGADAPAPA
jgi:hypothetical protein